MSFKVGDKVRLKIFPGNRYLDKERQEGAYKVFLNHEYGILVKDGNNTGSPLVDWYDKEGVVIASNYGIYIKDSETEKCEVEYYDAYSIDTIIGNLEKLEKKYE